LTVHIDIELTIVIFTVFYCTSCVLTAWY